MSRGGKGLGFLLSSREEVELPRKGHIVITKGPAHEGKKKILQRLQEDALIPRFLSEKRIPYGQNGDRAEKKSIVKTFMKAIVAVYCLQDGRKEPPPL